MESYENLWLWVGVIGMAVGASVIFLLGLNAHPARKHHYTLAFIVSLIATANYLAMALGQGSVALGSRIFYFARYTDWVFTTPLLLVGLALIALPTFVARERLNLLFGLVAADVFMIVTGFVAALQVDASKYIWYTLSSGAFIAVLVMLWNQLREEADRFPHAAQYRTLAGMLTALWVAYPIVWLLAPTGFSAISPSVTAFIYVVLDLTAKVGFGLVQIFYLRKESVPFDEQVRERETATSIR